ncbi:MAG: hypothetical protein Kow006_15630 [Gammaproteobacteria bacterium]
MQTEIFEKFKEVNQAALEPVVKLNQITSRAVERLAKQQLNLVSESLQEGVKQSQSFGEIKSLQDLLQKQSSLAAEYADKFQSQAQAALEILLETQAELNALAEENFKVASARVEEGFKAVAEKVEEGVKAATAVAPKKTTKKAA